MLNTHLNRSLERILEKKIQPNKVLIIFGARRVGKTKLIQKYLEKIPIADFLLLNGEDQRVIDALNERSISNYKRVIGSAKLLVIDEAQKVPDIGAKLKLIVDEIPNIKVLVTGSSVFDLSNKLGEPLVGRENTIRLFPIAQMEFTNNENFIQTTEKLESRLIYGSYPELEHLPEYNDKADYLEGLVNSLLLKDILEYEGIKKAGKILDLLRLIAYQVGKEVSVEELANSLKGISRNTVERYLDLLSKVFILYKVPGFSRNLRKEVTKSNRWFFYDNGIRNAVIRNFNPINLRNDIGDLWENYLMAERIKYNSYTQKRISTYFWRTYDKQEIDLIEEEDSKLSAYEFKWNPNKKVKPPGAWSKGYPDASFEVINKSNYLDFIT
jgi:predicted AAA+ superfamily ATPase